MSALVVRAGPLAGQRLEVSSKLVIGREGADVAVPDEQASRRHAAFAPAAGGIEVTDLGSLNGTWVDGGRISAPVVVGHGSTVQIGNTTFAVDAEAPQPFAPAGPPRSRRAATRRLAPAVLSFATIIATAVALVLYFGLR